MWYDIVCTCFEKIEPGKICSNGLDIYPGTENPAEAGSVIWFDYVIAVHYDSISLIWSIIFAHATAHLLYSVTQNKPVRADLL